MKGDAVRPQAEIARLQQQVVGHLDLATELPREWPIGALGQHDDPAEDAAPGCGARQFQ